jgi:hypothetical protein
VKPEFLQANADWYNAQAYAAPFDQSTVSDIKNWCYNHTTGKIDKIIDEIPPLAVMYLINAVDFDAKWLKQYERGDVENGVFHNHNGDTKNVKMLYSQESRYFIDDNSVGFTKAYQNSKYHFMALLPDEGVDIYEYIDSLNGEKWAGLWESANPRNENYTYREVHVRMPEFKYEVELSLNETLQALGVTDMFSPAADFSGIDETQPLYCEIVKQKSMIELDRNGTKAAAITLGGMNCMSAAPTEPLYITLDRPFVYAKDKAFEKLFGCQFGGLIEAQGEIVFDNGESVSIAKQNIVQCKTVQAKAIAKDENGNAVVLENQVGKGKVYFSAIAEYTGDNGVVKLMQTVMDTMGKESAEIYCDNKNIAFTQRVLEDGTSVLNLLNMSCSQTKKIDFSILIKKGKEWKKLNKTLSPCEIACIRW